MQRTAQKRQGRLGKLLTTEIGDYLGGRATEKLSPDFAQLVAEMGDIDDAVRAVALGESHGNAGAPEDPVSMKDLLKAAKSNTSSREYIKAVAELGRFHKKAFDIVNLLSKFKVNLDGIHEKFLFEDLDDETKGHLKSFKKKWASDNSYFIKEANIMNFFNMISKNLRGKALLSWEKIYPLKIKKLKSDTISILSLSDRMFNVILVNFKIMDKARTVRKPDKYLDAAEKIISSFKVYDSGDRGFKKYYDENVKGFLEKQEFFKDVPAVNAPGATVVTPSPVPGSVVKIPPMGPVPWMPPRPGLIQQVDPETKEVVWIDPQNRKEVIPQPPKEEFDPTKTQEIVHPQARVEIPKQKIDLSGKKASKHIKFYESLESMADESPAFMTAHIKRYASFILLTDPETALELFKIVKSVKE